MHFQSDNPHLIFECTMHDCVNFFKLREVYSGGFFSTFSQLRKRFDLDDVTSAKMFDVESTFARGRYTMR